MKHLDIYIYWYGNSPRCIINGEKKQNIKRYIIICAQRAKYMYRKLKYILNIYINYIYNLSLEEHYNFYEKQGLSKNEIIKKIAKDKNVSKNEIYKNFI